MKARLLVQTFENGKWNDRDVVPLTERGSDRPFSSGKVGYNGNDKLMLPSNDAKANGEERQHQFTCNIIEIVGKTADTSTQGEPDGGKK
jgi:hypothetical protein